MGLLDDAYAWVDQAVGGLLPGGEPATAASVIAAPLQAIAPFAGQAIRAVGAPAPAVVAPVGGLFGGPAAMQAAAGLPVSAPPAFAAAPRGRTITATATVYPDGTIVPRRMVPGRCLVTTEDIRTMKRVKKVSRQLARTFPVVKRKKRRYAAPKKS